MKKNNFDPYFLKSEIDKQILHGKCEDIVELLNSRLERNGILWRKEAIDIIRLISKDDILVSGKSDEISPDLLRQFERVSDDGVTWFEREECWCCPRTHPSDYESYWPGMIAEDWRTFQDSQIGEFVRTEYPTLFEVCRESAMQIERNNIALREDFYRA